MFQIAGVLLSLFVMAGNNIDRHHADAAAHMRHSQDQSAMSLFAASLTKYYVGFVRPGANFTDTVDEVTKNNRAYLGEQVSAQKLVGAGQLVGSKGVRWILFFKGDSLNEAKAIIDAAPAVQAGRFTGEVRQMWGTKGVGSQMADGEKVEAMTSGPKATYYLVVMKKGSKWSSEESEATRKLLSDHITNVWEMHKKGTLKFYGAFDDAGEIRGFGIVQANSLSEAKSLYKDDPVVKENWFRPEVLTFEVAEGVLP